MNFSYNWLREMVEDLSVSPAELMGLITIKTAECDGVHVYAPHLSTVRAAKVLSVAAIEGTRNVKAVVDAGDLGRRTVVCGAPNCRPGIVTAYVTAGTVLDGREIRRATIGGVESDGMLASGHELGINRDHSGIIELDLVPGQPLDIDSDHIIEVDNKSLTHRPDLWGHHGMAREVGAILKRRVLDPATALIPNGDPAISVAIEDLDLCPRYSALVFENVKLGPSPLWLQYRLQAIGLNPINNIVDLTNFVMAEIAQPMHAFDADKLRGGIVVRRAAEGETILALNEESYPLGPQNLVIADHAGPVAIAGVIGGMDSAISSETTRVVFESANFHAGSVRKTSAALRLRTDASMRFEKSQDPANTVRGLARVVELLPLVSPGARQAGGLADVARPARARPPIELPLEWLDRKIGRHVNPAEVRSILESLQFGVDEPRAGVFAVSVPSWRATKDISIKDDLVEEVGRVIGYASIPPQAPLLPASVPPVNHVRRCHHATRRLISARGFDEVYNYSFLSEETLRRFGLNPADHVRVMNPIAADQTHLRMTLVPGIWKNIVDDMRYFDEFRIFEIGVEIHKRADPRELPDEVNHLCAAVYQKQGDAEGLFELKRLAQSLSSAMEVRPANARLHEHPARTADVLLFEEKVGRLFEFHPDFVERGRAAVLDVNLDALMRLCVRDSRYQPLRRFPSSAFDLSVVAPVRALVSDLQTKLAGLAGSDLESIEYVRQYSGPPLADGMKSVSYRLTVSSPERTLSSDDVASIRARIIDGMKALGYELRV